jgi:tRNA G18 (ribose-2'-O)-methylase SpoU
MSDEEPRPPDAARPEVGVGPHPEPWPEDPRLDPELLAGGDRRNVVDRYRYWSMAAIRADLAARRRGFHVAIENWEHDLNIGTVVRNANAFGAAAVHIVGRRQWNRRGAMVTDRYLEVMHHPDVSALADWCAEQQLPIWAVDVVAGSEPMEQAVWPDRVLMLFGQEGPGITPAGLAAAARVVHITMVGSTRSLNAGVASGIAMYSWTQQRAGSVESVPPTPPTLGG